MINRQIEELQILALIDFLRGNINTKNNSLKGQCKYSDESLINKYNSAFNTDKKKGFLEQKRKRGIKNSVNFDDPDFFPNMLTLLEQEMPMKFSIEDMIVDEEDRVVAAELLVTEDLFEFISIYEELEPDDRLGGRIEEEVKRKDWTYRNLACCDRAKTYNNWITKNTLKDKFIIYKIAKILEIEPLYLCKGSDIQLSSFFPDNKDNYVVPLNCVFPSFYKQHKDLDHFNEELKNLSLAPVSYTITLDIEIKERGKKSIKRTPIVRDILVRKILNPIYFKIPDQEIDVDFFVAINEDAMKIINQGEYLKFLELGVFKIVKNKKNDDKEYIELTELDIDMFNEIVIDNEIEQYNMRLVPMKEVSTDNISSENISMDQLVLFEYKEKTYFGTINLNGKSERDKFIFSQITQISNKEKKKSIKDDGFSYYSDLTVKDHIYDIKDITKIYVCNNEAINGRYQKKDFNRQVSGKISQIKQPNIPSFTLFESKDIRELLSDNQTLK